MNIDTESRNPLLIKLELSLVIGGDGSLVFFVVILTLQKGFTMSSSLLTLSGGRGGGGGVSAVSLIYGLTNPKVILPPVGLNWQKESAQWRNFFQGHCAIAMNTLSMKPLCNSHEYTLHEATAQ